MHSVVNHVPIRPGADWDEMIRLIESLGRDILAAHAEVISMQVVRASDEEAILVINFADETGMKDFSSNIAGPWFAEHIRPFMGGPADRKTGEVVTHYQRS